MAAVTSSSPDIVVIGGGIMGTSIAWHLAQRKAGRVTLLERSTIAAGASGKTGALLRRHYSNRPEALLAHLSYLVFAQWNDIVGGDCGHVPTGVVFTVDTGPGHESNLAALHQNVALQNSIGIDSRVISPAELKALQPFAYVDDLQAASYEPTSGYVDAIAATRSMALAAVREGAVIREQCRVRGIALDNDRVAGVITDDGIIPAGTVVCAAGPWSPSILASTGLTLPIDALRVQIAIVHRPLELETPHFVFLDSAAGFFTRPWAPGRSLIGVSGGDQHDAVDPDNYDERNDLGYAARAIETAAKRIPAMANATYLHGHAGLYDMTPDAHPIIGETGIDGLYLAAGFSGAGFKKGPAVGQCLAELIVDGHAQTVDFHPFRLSRFDNDSWHAPWSETEYLFSTDFGHKF